MILKLEQYIKRWNSNQIKIKIFVLKNQSFYFYLKLYIKKIKYFLKFIYWKIQMKVIILAAWEGTRLRPLTLNTPKPLIKVFWKPILEYTLEYLYKFVDEFVIVVKYKKELFKDYLKDNYKWVKITYIEQWEEKWTGAAIKDIKISWDILIINWDSIFDKDDILNLVNLKWYWCLVKKVANPEKYWILKANENNEAIEIIEKPETYVWNLANLWVYKVNSDLVNYCNTIPPSKRWEIEITCALNLFFKKFPFKLLEIKWDFLDISYPEDIEKTENILKDKLLVKPIFWEAIQLEKIWDLDLYLWIRKEFIDDLIKFSTNLEDTSLINNTWDLKRFSSLEKFEKWYNDEDRFLFTLVWEEKKLAWIWWARPSKLPTITQITDNEIAHEVINNEKDSHTSWIRIYPDFRWKWLAKIILKTSTYFYRKIFPSAYICVDVDKNNIPSQKTYEKNWYIFFWYWENKKTVESEVNARLLYVEKPYK